MGRIVRNVFRSLNVRYEKRTTAETEQQLEYFTKNKKNLDSSLRRERKTCWAVMMMMSHAEPVIGLVFHPYCRHPSDGGAHQTDSERL